MKEKVVAAMDTSIDTASRTALDSDFKSILRQITQVVQNAAFDGANLLNGSLAANIQFLANADATGFITLSTQNLSLGGAIITMPSAARSATVDHRDQRCWPSSRRLDRQRQPGARQPRLAGQADRGHT